MVACVVKGQGSSLKMNLRVDAIAHLKYQVTRGMV